MNKNNKFTEELVKESKENHKLINDEIDTMGEAITKIRVSMAERVFYGGIGGALITGVFKLLELFAK